jgi:hypothetical protein
MTSLNPPDADPEMKLLYRVAGVCAAVIAALIPIQAFLFIAFPPPSDVAGYFELFQEHPLRGLLDLDLLLSLDNILTIAIFLGLYHALKRANKSLATIGSALGMIGVVLYLVSREATFSMLMLSSKYAAAATEAERATLISAGQTMLTIFNGSTFDVSYILGAIAILVLSAVMVRRAVLGRAIAWAGLMAGMLMLVPPTVGTVGVYVSMFSLVPTMAWLIMLAAGFSRLARARTGNERTA